MHLLSELYPADEFGLPELQRRAGAPPTQEKLPSWSSLSPILVAVNPRNVS
jgi:hypothetical protein